MAQPGLTSYHLKLVAAATMLLDHIGAIFYPEAEWLRWIGRLSFPLFVWLLVQGASHTRHIDRYALRLGLLGSLSQPLYGLAFGSDRLNILFLLLLGLGCLHLAQRRPQLEVPAWLFAAGAAALLDISYGAYGIALMVLVAYFRPDPMWWFSWIGFHLVWAYFAGGFQLPALVAPVLFTLANGQRGPRARWFYGFYPGHLAVLWWLDRVG